MSVAELLTASISIGNKIDVLWNIFIAVHLAIFTLYHFVTRGGILLTRSEKILAGSSYFVFLLLNGNALNSSYTLLSEIDIYLQYVLSLPENAAIFFRYYYLTLDYSLRPGVVIATHVFAFAVVMFGVVFRQKWLQRPGLTKHSPSL